MLSSMAIDYANRSVLCWLATCDAQGQPNVSPKEVFAPLHDRHLLIANIASPVSARNIELHPRVCVSFVDVFVQKGCKLIGSARNLKPGAAEYAQHAAPLEAMVQGLFEIRSVFVVEVTAVEPIIAPSYWRYPERTTEESQRISGMRTYGVQPLPDKR